MVASASPHPLELFVGLLHRAIGSVPIAVATSRVPAASCQPMWSVTYGKK
jgi:hypothetical protein